VSRRWWPWKRRSDTSKKQLSPGEERDKRLDETRRILRHVAKEALHSKQEPAEEELPEPAPSKKTFSVTTYGEMVHVSFHREDLLLGDTFLKKDPITKKLKRVAKRFDRSDVFYTKDGRLIDD